MILLYFTFLLFYRITEQIGSISSLPILSNSEELTKWIESNPISVIFFMPKIPSKEDISTNNDIFDQLRYANYAISKYKTKINFSISTKNLLNQSNLIPSDYVIVKSYKNGHEVSNKPFQQTSASFSLWCQETLFGTETKKIIYHEELRDIFEGHQNVVIGVDDTPKPSHFPKNQVFYQCPSNLFTLFNINLTRGVYVYRSGDRQLVGPISSNYKNYMKSNIVDIENIYTIEPKRFLAGFFVDDRNNTLIKDEIKILNKLAEKYKKDIQFTSLERGRICMNIFMKGNYINMSFPFFFVLDTNALSLNESKSVFRWAISNHQKMHDFNYLCSFIEDILNGKGDQYPHISDEIDNRNSLQIVRKNFDQKIISNDDKHDKIVAFIRKENHDSTKTRVTLKKVQSLLKDFVNAFYFDYSKNDLPEIVAPHVKRLPLIAYFPKGNETNPLILYPPFNFDQIVSNISMHSSMHFKIPEYDPYEMKMSIIEELSSNPPHNDEL